VVPILVTLLFLVVLVAVASVSYYLIERPGQKLVARLAQSRWRRSPATARPVSVAQ
jgi:peptidoglycan/LPS O-acetylase OafA/YrhL